MRENLIQVTFIIPIVLGVNYSLNYSLFIMLLKEMMSMESKGQQERL
jgi:hypothetical protein